MEQQSFVVNTTNADETESFAESLGRQLRGGEVIELIGDVGAGKTTFVRGFVRGAGSDDRVTSPTFTVSNVYKSPNVSVHHYDFYRIDDLAIMKSELEEVLTDKGSVVILEWADSMQAALPIAHVRIQIAVADEHARTFTCSVPPKYKYIEVLS